MKRFLAIALVAASVGFIAVGTASAANPATFTPSAATYNAGDAANGIAESRHNLGSLAEHIGTVQTGSPSTSTSEICVFCHTPHHSNTGVVTAPIWNRNNSTAATYVAYGPTIGSPTNSSVLAPGSASLACLSCHDGVTTFDNIANKPGKGTGAMNATFWDKGAVVSKTMTSGRLNVGTNLSNDHPVSIAYSNDGRASLRPSATVISSIDVAFGLADSASTFDGGNLTKNLWAVKGYINAGATIADLLRVGNVECSSCHDPHFNNKSFNEVDNSYGTADQEFESNGLFLRRVGGNSGSGVCRTCHNK